MNKSYFSEISENVTIFVTESIFVEDTIKERRRKQTIAFIHCSYMLGLLFVKDHKD